MWCWGMYDRKTAKKDQCGVPGFTYFVAYVLGILPGEVESSGGLSRPILAQTSMDRMWQGTFQRTWLEVQMAQFEVRQIFTIWRSLKFEAYEILGLHGLRVSCQVWEFHVQQFFHLHYSESDCSHDSCRLFRQQMIQIQRKCSQRRAFIPP